METVRQYWWLAFLTAACGRLGFDDVNHGADAAVGETDAAVDSPPRIAVTWRGVFVARDMAPNLTVDTFAVQAVAAGDVVLIHLACERADQPTSVSLTAPGWTFTPLDPILGSVSGRLWSATFTAVSPNTTAATATVTWTQTCASGTELGDEFSNADPAGGAVTFASHVQMAGVGDCNTELTTGHDHAAVWAACTSQLSITAPGPGFTKGADNLIGDWSEHAITSDPAGTLEPVSFMNNGGSYVVSATTIKPVDP